MKKLILKESQVKKLIDGLLNEQNSDKVIFSVNFQNAFPSGQYNLNPEYEKIVNDNIEKIDQFIKGKKIQNFKLVITSGESQVPNPQGFEERGSLAKKRSEILKGYLDIVLPNILGVRPTIEISQPVIGRTPWIPNKDNKDDPKYTAEQFVMVNVVISPEQTPPPYKRESKIGEGIFLNSGYSNYLIGFISEPFVDTSNIEDAGLQKVGYQNLIFTEVKKDTQPPQIVAKYEVPWEWWNKDRDLAKTKNITQSDLEKIRTFKKVI
jgi:hypothetical protein